MTIALLLVASGFAGATETTTPTGEILITGEERWEDVDRTLTQRLVIAPGASLVIQDASLEIAVEDECTIVQLNGYYCKPDIHVLAGGELVIESSEIVRSEYPSFLRTWTISADGGEATIQDSTITKTAPIVAQGPGASLTFTGNDVSDVAGEVAVWRGATGLIEANTFTGSAATAGAQDASPVIRANTFTDVSTAVRAQASIAGEKAFETAPVIEGNTFIGGGTGIFTDSGYGAEITGNTFESQQYQAISHRIPVQDSIVHRTPATITGNVFVDQHKVLDVYTPGHSGPEQASELEFHQNSIDAWCVYISARGGSNAPLTVDATENWWGSADGPGQTEDPNCDPFFEHNAEIIVDPALDSPPEESA